MNLAMEAAMVDHSLLRYESYLKLNIQIIQFFTIDIPETFHTVVLNLPSLSHNE